MKYTLDHQLQSSVYLWLDNLLIEKGGGFANYTGQLTKVTNFVSGFNSYASPQRQWVYDASIPGVTVPSSISVNGTPNFRSTNLKLDFNKGGAYAVATLNGTITATYSYKEVNLYNTTMPEEKILFDEKFSPKPETTSALPTDLRNQVYPCIFIKMGAGTNSTISFDKMVSTVVPVRLTFLADSPYLYSAVTSLLRDTHETHIPIFKPSELPFNEFNDLKTGNFDYSQSRTFIQSDSGDRLAYVKTVSVSNFPDRVNSLMHPKTFGGFIDLELEVLRFPNQT